MIKNQIIINSNPIKNAKFVWAKTNAEFCKYLFFCFEK